MNTIGRFVYVLRELGLGLILVPWMIYCGVHWLFTGRDITLDRRYAIVRFLFRR
jgi:hypothetical protein